MQLASKNFPIYVEPSSCVPFHFTNVHLNHDSVPMFPASHLQYLFKLQFDSAVLVHEVLRLHSDRKEGYKKKKKKLRSHPDRKEG
jgi:hypothetical protein